MANQDIYPIAAPSRLAVQFRDTNWLASTLVTLLRQYFSSPERISLEKGRFLWNAVTAQSLVEIDVVDNLKFDEGNKFPKMLVDVEDQNFAPDVIGDSFSYNPETGSREFVNRNISNFSVECWGLFKLESTSIADEVRYFIQAFRHEIQATYGFSKIRVRQVLKPVRYQTFKDYWICRLIVEFEIQERWGVTEESLKVSDFVLKLQPKNNLVKRPGH